MSHTIENDPNKMYGVPEEEMDRRFVKMVDLAKKELRLKGIPTQEYDAKRNRVYLRYADGHREYIDG